MLDSLLTVWCVGWQNVTYNTTSQEDTMSNTDHARKTRNAGRDNFGRRQPRPAPRRQGTRVGVLAAVRREG